MTGASNGRRPFPKECAGDILEVLADLWPAAFFVEPSRRRPLKAGIDRDVLTAADGAITREELKIALGSYTSAKAYLRALREGELRIGLDGEPAGQVSASDARHAQWVLEQRIAKESARVRARALAQQGGGRGRQVAAA
jgi:ProP effector